jgi:xanthine dehydrogenase large subunit
MNANAGRPLAHESGARHVSGEALYVDDIAEPAGCLHAFILLSPHAHARVLRVDASAARAMPGVAAVLLAADVPGVNDVGPAFPGDPIFAAGLVEYAGQSVLAVAAETLAQARAAAKAVVVDYEKLPAVMDIDTALAAESFVLPTQRMRRGEPEAALAKAPHRLAGRHEVGGQDHFYLEGQVALAVPGEDDELRVISSTQHPTEVQHLVARALKVPDHAVVCETRRLGGAFGGKESQASLIAVVAALLAAKTGRACKLRLDRDDDMLLTGKRHDFRIDWDVGFGDDGVIQGLDLVLASRCGMSPDLSAAINDRAMFHSDNAYFLPNVSITSYRCKTNMVSATAFRGFGGPQGMMGIEAVVDAIARHLKLDPLVVRQRNFYREGRDTTHYGMLVEDNPIEPLVAQLAESAGYAARRAEVAAFNTAHPWRKRGLALTPVKFGISFTLLQMNQAGALVHVYTDGSVQANHAGVEMGQGLHTKIAQLVADEFGLEIGRVRITATATDKVPNTSPTAASAGTDLNGQAARRAARTIRERMAAVVADGTGVAADAVRFEGGEVIAGERRMSFAEAAKLAHRSRISLSSTGYYRTPKIHYDYATQQGRPFFYFAWGACCAEVEVDTLTGEYRLLRADILHDVGRSLNPALDRGQVEGGFVQGMGWLTMEELVWDGEGWLRTHAPSTYKIPAAGDIPAALHVAFFDRPNAEETVHRAKAVGEPPLMLGIAVFHALRDAVSAAGEGRAAPLDAPATPERVLFAIEALRA